MCIQRAIAFPDAKTIADNAFENTAFGGTVGFAEAEGIGNAAFKGCTISGATTFTVATTIGANAFQNCTFKADATFTKVTSIGNEAFRGAKFDTHALTFGAVIATLGDNSFLNAQTVGATANIKSNSEGNAEGVYWAGATWRNVTVNP